MKQRLLALPGWKVGADFDRSVAEDFDIEAGLEGLELEELELEGLELEELEWEHWEREDLRFDQRVFEVLKAVQLDLKE
jgi:hypothetical protein